MDNSLAKELKDAGFPQNGKSCDTHSDIHDGTLVERVGFARRANGCSDEETNDPLITDARNFYKVEKWLRDGIIDRLLYTGNNLDRARTFLRRR